MKLKTVRARQGLGWVRGGFTVFFRQPLLFGALFGMVAMAVLLLAQLPFVGPVLALALMPPATLVFMLGTRSVLEDRTPLPHALLAPLADALLRRRFAVLGLAYAVATLIALAVVQQLDGGRFDATLQALAEGKATAETLRESGFVGALALRAVLLSLLSLLFWHAPALLHWGRMEVAKAVFASGVACLRSLGAFAVMGLAWLGLSLAFALLAQTTFLLLGRPEAAALAMVPVAMLLTTVFYASLYFSFADSFDTDG